MFCSECGNKRKPSSAFCINCGKKFVSRRTDTVHEPVAASQEMPKDEQRDEHKDSTWDDYFSDYKDEYSDEHMQVNKPYPNRTRLQNNTRSIGRSTMQRHKLQPKQSKKIIIATIVIFAIAAIFLFASIFNRTEQPLTVREMLDLGEKYLRDLEYEQAVEQFLNIIEIEPRNPRGYTGAADAYLGMEKPEEAMSVLQQGREVLPNEPTITEMIRDVVEEFPYIKDESINTLLETPPVSGDSSIAEQPTNVGEYAPDWKTAYRSFIEQYVEQFGSDRNWDFSGGFTISLLDLNFDGIPELIIDDGDHWISFREIHYLSDSGVSPVLRSGFETGPTGIGVIQLLMDKVTGEQIFISTGNLGLAEWGASYPGFIREFSTIDGVLTLSQVITINYVGSDANDWGYFDDIWRFDADRRFSETLTITDNPQLFVAYLYNSQGRQTAMSSLEYLDFKRNYMDRFEILGTYSWDFPVSIRYHSHTPDISIDEFLAMWG
jgi:tetratricopeptide (TPR) repeat protein